MHNPNKLHDDGCAPFVPHLVAYPLDPRQAAAQRSSTGPLAQCHGGPGRAPRWAWPYEGFLASTDPVALDAVGWQVSEARRKEVGPRRRSPTRGASPRYIAGAARLGLGVADLARIERAEV